ncbi:MAG: hypothetical protein JWM19_80 [Actinomycetia bacterium]|nr:hypothetical protein [Actinomycetes bacterium]
MRNWSANRILSSTADILRVTRDSKDGKTTTSHSLDGVRCSRQAPLRTRYTHCLIASRSSSNVLPPGLSRGSISHSTWCLPSSVPGQATCQPVSAATRVPLTTAAWSQQSQTTSSATSSASISLPMGFADLLPDLGRRYRLRPLRDAGADVAGGDRVDPDAAPDVPQGGHRGKAPHPVLARGVDGIAGVVLVGGLRYPSMMPALLCA